MRMRKLILKLHTYVGLTAGLLLALCGLTGSLLVFGEELDRALNPSLLRVEPGTEVAPLQAVLDAARQTLPGEKPSRIRLPREDDNACEVCFTAEGDPRCVYVDPYSARVLGTRVPAQSFKGRLFYLHRRLLSGEAGETVVGVGGILLLALSLSGVVLWWPGRGKLARGLRVKWNGGRRRLTYDLHSVSGVCAMLFLGVTAFTGAAMVFRPSFESALNRLSPRHQPAGKPASTPRPGSKQASLEAVMRSADAALPDARTTFVTLPATATAPIVVRKRQPGELQPSGRSLVYLDQYSGEVLSVESAFETPPGTRAGNYLYPLHVGLAGGTLTRVLQVFVGFAPAVLFFTGFLMWRSRVIARNKVASRAPQAGRKAGGDECTESV